MRWLYAAALLASLGSAGCRDVVPRPGALVDSGGAPGDAAPPDVTVDPIDGAPTRVTCTSTFRGDLLDGGTYGRLDGYLVAIVQPASSARPCRADLTHVHLQVRVDSVVYDIAVNVGDDVHSQRFDHAMFTPWAEGWHTGADFVVDYAGLGLHAATMPRDGQAALVAAVNADLAGANHISIYATGYGPDGAHLVHFNGGGRDGLIITQPLSPTSHMRAFSFDSSSF
ncbi:MAG TPA: hypothetical protein VFP84_08395 [Kofleriaceae bacterium]|nr:hypothetical protein [Kofleriaceae bacterium]